MSISDERRIKPFDLQIENNFSQSSVLLTITKSTDVVIEDKFSMG
jgi:hypothetical protein